MGRSSSRGLALSEMHSSRHAKGEADQTWIQTSTLLPSLFEVIDREQRINVLHVGPALQETVDFFSEFRCKLHFVDLFAELPFAATGDTEPSVDSRFLELLQFPEDTRFDICLFWDLFNFLDEDAIFAFQAALLPYITSATRAHAFSVHSQHKARANYLYGIQNTDSLSIRERTATLPGYRPHSQRRLQILLQAFHFQTTVLLADSRLEILLRARG